MQALIDVSIINIPQGPAGASAVIPFASGTTPAALVPVLGGLANTGTLLGFSQPGIGDYAFVAPRAGAITSLAGFFSATATVSLLSPIQIQLQIFIAPMGSNTFVPQIAPLLLTPSFNIITIGDTATGIINLNIPVVAGDKILLYATAQSAIASTVTEFISAGIAIS
nr:exosporium glycoprotein BclB-related protein [Bacillus cereus]